MIKKILNSNNFIIVLIIMELLLALVTTYAFSMGTLTVFCCVSLVVLLVLPCVLMGQKSVGSFFRFTSLFLAFIPSLNPDVLSGLLKNSDLFSIEITIDRCLTLLSVFNKELIPVMLILFAIYKTSGLKLKKWHIVLVVTSALSLIGMLCLPALSEVFLYVMTYLLLVPTFYFLEKVYETCKEKYEKIPMSLFVTVLFFRGIYQMLAILEIYPLS